MAEITGCARITGTVAGSSNVENQIPLHDERSDQVMNARVGQKAPEFTAPSYYRGSFTPVKLSDFEGKWILLCFYPGDFTFV